jgi:hydroxyacylglutathione hydrolase
MMIERYTLGMVQTNCYFLWEESKKQAIIVDPGDNADYIGEMLKKNGLIPCGILLTHGHFDHILAVEELKKIYKIPVYASLAEKEVLEDPKKNLTGAYGTGKSMKADIYVKDNEIIEAGGLLIRVIDTPGHTAGSCCYLVEKEGVLISGDTLFEESVGRTDFPTGSMSALVRGVKERLFVLPDETRVYPGHGSMTTIGHEKKYNMFLQ